MTPSLVVPLSCENLQQAMHTLENWCAANNLAVNHDKCCVITITNNLNPVCHQYIASNGASIPRSTAVKDLGVIIDPTLKFDAHVEATVNKAFCSLGFAIRASRCFRQVDSVIHLYRALVAPHLEYASSIWCPYFIEH